MVIVVIGCSTIDGHLHSDHIPVTLSFYINVSHSAVSKRPHMVKKAWHKANDCHVDMYKCKLKGPMKSDFSYLVFPILLSIIYK